MRLPFTFYRASPTEYVVKFVVGRRRKEGAGRIFFAGPRTVLARFPVTEQVVSFAFSELTSDSQRVMVQGELHARLIVDKMLERRDFTFDAWTGAYNSEDPENVLEEVVHAFQSYVRREVALRPLKEILATAAEVEAAVRSAIAADAAPFDGIGARIERLFVMGITPENLDLKKALEAEAREKMLAAADKAVAERRRAAAENDRALKEYEAETERGLEERRAEMVKVRNANTVAEAEADAKAIEMRLAPYREIDAGTLLALGIKEMGASGRVGTFAVTPELLAAVTGLKNGDVRERGR